MAMTRAGIKWYPFIEFHKIFWILTHEHLEMFGCTPKIMATNAMVLKLQAINIHSTDQKCVLLVRFHVKSSMYSELRNKIIIC